MSSLRKPRISRSDSSADGASIDSTEVLAKMVEMSGKTRYAFAKAAAMHPAALYRYLDPAGPKMTTATLQRVAEANGFRLSVRIKR